MAMNDRDPTLSGSKAVDTYPGVANPTSFESGRNRIAAKFVDDPISQSSGAGAGTNFEGGADAARSLKQSAGVIGHIGIIETSNIDPLHHDASKNASAAGTPDRGSTPSQSQPQVRGMGQRAYDPANTATGMAGGVGRMAYGTAVGDESAKRAGQQAFAGEKK